MRARFVLSEIGIGLWRNVTMTVSAVLTVAVSLAVLGVGILFNSQIDQTRAFWYDQIELSVFLCAGPGDPADPADPCDGAVTSSERDAVRSTLETLPEVQGIVYESQQEAFVRFQEQFQDSPDLVRNVTADVLPESFRVQLEDPEDFSLVTTQVEDLAGVESVLDVDRLLGNFFTTVGLARLVTFIVSGTLVLVAVLLIYNTVRVAAYSRRRETGIMRLVGASNFSIRLPFVLEGAIAGLAGAALACGLLAAFYYWVFDRLLRPSLSNLTTFVGWETVAWTSLALLLFGAVLSAAASFVTLQRHLKV